MSLSSHPSSVDYTQHIIILVDYIIDFNISQQYFTIRNFGMMSQCFENLHRNRCNHFGHILICRLCCELCLAPSAPTCLELRLNTVPHSSTIVRHSSGLFCQWTICFVAVFLTIILICSPLRMDPKEEIFAIFESSRKRKLEREGMRRWGEVKSRAVFAE